MGRRLKRSMLGWWPIKMFNMLLLATALVWSTGRDSLAEGAINRAEEIRFGQILPRSPPHMIPVYQGCDGRRTRHPA